MKNALRITALMLCLLLCTAFMVACSKDDSKTDSNGGTDATEAIAANSIVGSWECKDYAGAVYNFNSDGTGTYEFGGGAMNFTYEDSGESVSILYEGNTIASEYSYTIDGDTLNISDSTGETVVYIKK